MEYAPFLNQYLLIVPQSSSYQSIQSWKQKALATTLNAPLTFALLDWNHHPLVYPKKQPKSVVVLQSALRCVAHAMALRLQDLLQSATHDQHLTQTHDVMS